MCISSDCCRWSIGFQFTLGLTALFMWLSLRPSKPTLSIEKFYVPALNKTAISNLSVVIPPVNTTVTFDLKLRNENKDKGVCYDDLNITLYYGPSHSVVGHMTLPSFYQGHKKTAHRNDGLRAERRATRTVSEQNSMVFGIISNGADHQSMVIPVCFGLLEKIHALYQVPIVTQLFANLVDVSICNQ
ncbi:protein NDR1-like [Magnolia sinica]|uniref:protein NDR1-like n=1 Tax=Magnolia sinica TaxID=86752 RepID=UPI00265B715A|nr:protein NDR1-like [Magnolia sinica]